MTSKRAIEGTVFLIVLCLAGVFLRGWVSERHARAAAETKVAAAAKIQKQSETAIAERDATASRLDAELAAQSAAIKTPQQAIRVVTKYLPGGVVTVERSELSTALQQQLPEAPGPVVVLTSPQVEQLAHDELACTAAKNDRDACTADLVDVRKELVAQQAASKALNTAVKGGSKWHRFGRVLKLVGCAAGGAGIGALLDGHPAGSAVGAAAAVAGCSLF